MSPRRKVGPCTVVAVDPGTTTGLLVASVDARWLRGNGPATWEGLGAAVKFRMAYQVGRYPKTFDMDTGLSTALDEEAVDEAIMPILAADQPLLGGSTPSLLHRLYGILNGDPSQIARGDLPMVDAGEVMQVRQIAGLFENFPEAALLIEDFSLRTQDKSRETLSPTRLRLAIETEEILHGQGRVPFLQQPSVMSTATDERMKRAGLYFRGMVHATDAARHTAVFLRNCRANESLRAQAFPLHFADWEDNESEET
jgi:hypothetical protein